MRRATEWLITLFLLCAIPTVYSWLVIACQVSNSIK